MKIKYWLLSVAAAVAAIWLLSSASLDTYLDIRTGSELTYISVGQFTIVPVARRDFSESAPICIFVSSKKLFPRQSSSSKHGELYYRVKQQRQNRELSKPGQSAPQSLAEEFISKLDIQGRSKDATP